MLVVFPHIKRTTEDKDRDGSLLRFLCSVIIATNTFHAGSVVRSSHPIFNRKFTNVRYKIESNFCDCHDEKGVLTLVKFNGINEFDQTRRNNERTNKTNLNVNEWETNEKIRATKTLELTYRN